MISEELSRQLQKINWLIQQTSNASAREFELQSHWGRYLCILVAGFLENAIGEVYSEFTQRAASKPVANYASAILVTIQNPKAQRFLETARAFKQEWAEELEAFISDEGRKDAIDGIMSNRHLIAHGRDAGITVARVRDYLEKCIEVIEFIERQCGRGS
jgi:hypothetical protein